MISSRARTLRKRFFLTASASDWNDWRWQLRQRIKALDTLEAEDPLREDAHSPVPGLVHRYPDPAATVSCSGSSLREEEPGADVSCSAGADVSCSAESACV